MLINLVIYLLSFVAIWAGSGLIVASISKLSHRIKVPSFFISFVILGILTSTPELAVGLSSVSSNSPDIFVGNLLGGILLLFLFVIPALAILGRGINIQTNLTHEIILLSVFISILPFVAVFDGKVTGSEAILLIVSYVAAVLFLQWKQGFLKSSHSDLLTLKKYSFVDIIKVLLGTAMVLISSNLIVSKTVYFSAAFHIAPFYISLFALSLGTNLPEITIAARAIVSGKKDIAFGDYLGSAAANTLLLGIFTLLSKEPVIQVDTFAGMFLIALVGLGLFYAYSRTARVITKKEGIILLFIYIVFIMYELRDYFLG